MPEGLEDVRCGADRGRCLSGRSRRHRSRRLPRRQGSRQASGSPNNQMKHTTKKRK